MRTRMQSKSRSGLKKLSETERNKALEMMNQLNQFLQKNGKATMFLDPAKKDDKKEEEPVKDPRFDDKQGLKDLLIKASTKKRDVPLMIMEGQDNLPSDYEDLEGSKECVLKQGFLGLVTDVSSDKTSKQPILTAKATFAVLNKKTLSFFSKENMNSLIKTVDITHMKPSYYPVEWKGLFCWQLVAANRVFLLESYIQRGASALPEEQSLATICTNTQHSMDDWLKAIQRFHNCMVTPMPEEIKKEETEFDRATGWYRVLKSRRVKNQADDDKEGEEDDQNELDLMKDYMKKFKQEILDKKAEETQERREKTVELDEAIEEAKTQQVQNECLDKALEIKGEEEEKEVEQMIQTESELRETKELDKKKKELLKGLDKESKRIIESQDDLTEAVRKMREEMKQKMVQVVTGLNRYTDSEMCYFMEFNFPDTVRSTSQKIKMQCETMVDIQNVDIDLTNQCLLETGFCRVCCNYNIGEMDAVGREQCQQKCNDQLKGDTPSDRFLMHFEVTDNLKKQKKDEEELLKKTTEMQEKQMKEIAKQEAEQAKKNAALQKENEENERKQTDKEERK